MKRFLVTGKVGRVRSGLRIQDAYRNFGQWIAANDTSVGLPGDPLNNPWHEKMDK